MRKLRSAVTLCMLAFLLLGCFAVLAAETQTEVPLRLTLHVKNWEGKTLFYQGQSISIQVALVDQRLHLKPPAHEKEDQEKEKVERFTVGTKEWPWFNGLTLRIERIVKNTKGSTGREPVLEELDWKKQMILPRPGGYVGNEPGYDVLIAVFELDLNTSQSLEPGQYIVKVVWDSTNTPADALPVWHGRLQAEEVTIDIVAAKTPQERGKLACTRALWYLRHKNHDKAIASAQEAEKMFPAYRGYECYHVAAIAYERKGDLKSALHYYRKYAEAHKDANPKRWPYILEVRRTIKHLESQLEQADVAALCHAASFFGVGSVGARTAVYVVDHSGSMTDSIDYVKWELKRSIGELNKGQKFHVIFYSSGPPLEMPTRRLVSATDRNKEMAFEFIEGIIAEGQTDPSKAIQRAFACRPELIYLLTDGEFDKANVGLVKRLNAASKVKVHTIGFLYRIGEVVLKRIADENGGNYKFVSEGDLEALVR